MIKVGVLGTGDVGQVLGTGFAEAGHDVKLGSRDPDQEKIRKWVKRAGSRASAGTYGEAAAFGDVIVLATLWAGTENAIRSADPKSFAGKVVIDATNPLDFSQGLPPKLAVGHTDSGGERVQLWLPDSHVVKAFNSVGSPHMVGPDFPDGPPDMFICGNDARAKQTVTDLLDKFGWSVVDIGDIQGARYLEPLAMIWILEYFHTNSGNHAFRLLRK